MSVKTEYSTIFGIATALTLIGIAIALGNNDATAFFDLPAVLIVIGGTFLVTIACFSVGDIVNTVAVTSRTIFYAPADRNEIKFACLRLSGQAKKEGILSLQKLSQIYGNMHNFFRKYITLIIDGVATQEIEKLCLQEITSIAQKQRKSIEILRKAAEIAPAMGLIGTLIGLVQMLGNLSDPSKIGPAMAIALLTTLYGAVMAYMILLPLSTKLDKNSKDEIELLKVYSEAILSISRGEGPTKLEMKMNANFSPQDRMVKVVELG